MVAERERDRSNSEIRCVSELNSLKRLSKEGGWIVAGQIATVLGSLVLVRVMTEYLRPEQYGELALGLTLAGLVNQVVMGGVSNAISRFYSIAVDKGDLAGYMTATRQLLWYAALVVVAIAVSLIVFLVLDDKTNWLGLVAAMLVFSILAGFHSSLNGIQNAARQRSVVALHTSVDAWMKIGMAIVVMGWFGYSSTSVVLGYIASAIVVMFSQLFFLRRLLHARIVASCKPAQKDWITQMWQFGWPYSAWGIFTWLQLVSDRWALQYFSSIQEVGRYAVLYQLGFAPIVIFTGLAVSFLAPILYQRSGDATDLGRNKSVHQTIRRISFAGLGVTAFGFLISFQLHEWVFKLLSAPTFRSVSNYLPWMVLAGGVFAVGQILSIKLASERNTKSMIFVKIVTALLGVALNIIGAWKFGILGIVFAVVAFSTVYFFWMAWLVYQPAVDVIE